MIEENTCVNCGDPAKYKSPLLLDITRGYTSYWCGLECYNTDTNGVSQFVVMIGPDCVVVNRHEKPLEFEEMNWRDQNTLRQEGWVTNPNWIRLNIIEEE